ncbi:MAG: hypothetical protein WA184_07085 [Stellaceae bacterium]|jgi:hypothetical protein
MVWFYLLAAALGMAIGASEVVSRYRDAPAGALQTVSAWLYVALNASASLAAYALVRQLPELSTIGGVDDSASKQLIQAMAAGLSAMALFRSSLFTIRVANTDVAIGPAAFLQILLSAADRATDRARARPRAHAVQEIMVGISFERAKEALPSLCFGLMQGLTPEEQAAFGISVKALESSDMEDTFKANSLGLNLLNLVGEPVLREAVNMLRIDISAKPRPIVQSILTLQLLRRVDFAQSHRTLVDGCLFVANKMGDASLPDDLASTVDRIAALRVSDQRKVLFLSAMLIGRFGEDTVQLILESLPENAPPQALADAKSESARPAPAGAVGAAPAATGEQQDDKVVPLHPETAEPEPPATGAP